MHGKPQIPRFKPQRNFKLQTRNHAPNRRLKFGFWSFSGAWMLVLGAFFLFPGPAPAQLSSPAISKIEIRHVGPPAVSEELIRANIRVKVGDPYLPTAIDDDVRNLYATGLFYNIKVDRAINPDGVVLTYVVQGK